MQQGLEGSGLLKAVYLDGRLKFGRLGVENLIELEKALASAGRDQVLPDASALYKNKANRVRNHLFQI